ncbi:hypothetical protein [Spongiactinospora sp. TRM90649]|uniref:hypothetical protein n=1 Tax=Spongiactinospora sp. TRM90649 TaxID=3031114 RepID=UPI0023F9ADC6|nr:hypothetical protein [Spongiactinospora sp. TRM90649]MDF5758251.1 hypothetical protein [Spongiactinospora sp. TRM90649]
MSRRPAVSARTSLARASAWRKRGASKRGRAKPAAARPATVQALQPGGVAEPDPAQRAVEPVEVEPVGEPGGRPA